MSRIIKEEILQESGFLIQNVTLQLNRNILHEPFNHMAESVPGILI
jgi:hypothetical protein